MQHNGRRPHTAEQRESAIEESTGRTHSVVCLIAIITLICGRKSDMAGRAQLRGLCLPSSRLLPVSRGFGLRGQRRLATARGKCRTEVAVALESSSRGMIVKPVECHVGFAFSACHV